MFGGVRRLQSMGVAMSTLCKNKFSLPEGFSAKTSVWLEYMALAQEYKPINLGQGFPDYSPPKEIFKDLADIALSDNVLLNQYTRGVGHPRLTNAISKCYANFICRELNPLTEVIVTIGAYEALFCALIGHTKPGDEVIIIEPFFECYAPIVRQARGIPRFIPLKPRKTTGEVTSDDWVMDEQELCSMFNEKTKAIVVNSPHNPTGKVFNQREMCLIAELCKKWDVMCIADEAYEWIVYKPKTNIRMCTLPGMWERTVTIGTSGKTFSVTGWKIGWAYGPDYLIKNLMIVHQNCVGQTPTPTQEAVARAFEREAKRLDKPDCYLFSISEEMRAKRDFTAKFLKDAGMVPTIPEGGYFMIADWTGLTSKINLDQEKDQFKDYRFTKWMTKNVKLQGIPPTAFYSDEHKSLGENYVRYCFFKKDETLQKAAQLLQAWKQKK